MTPFDTALKADLQTLQHTVEYEGQNFRERDADGNTLLHCAVRSGSLAKVAYLTDFLALDPLEANLSGITPLDLLSVAGSGSVPVMNQFVENLFL